MVMVMIIMYIYHALINAMSAHMIHIKPFTAPACEIARMESTPKNNIADDVIKNLLSVLCLLIEIFLCAHAKRGNALMISNVALLLAVSE